MLTQWQVTMNDNIVVLKQLDELKEQHRKLDHEIAELSGSSMNEFRLAQLKKQKLRMRDQIIILEQETLSTLIKEIFKFHLLSHFSSFYWATKKENFY